MPTAIPTLRECIRVTAGHVLRLSRKIDLQATDRAVGLRLRAMVLLRPHSRAGKDAQGALTIRSARKIGCRCGQPATRLAFFPHEPWQHLPPDEMWTCEAHAGMSESRLVRIPTTGKHEFTAFWHHPSPCPIAGKGSIVRYMGPSKKFPVYSCPHRTH